MDANWKRTYDALTELRREIADGKEPHARHLSAERRLDLLRAVDAVRNDTDSCKRLGEIFERASV